MKSLSQKFAAISLATVLSVGSIGCTPAFAAEAGNAEPGQYIVQELDAPRGYQPADVNGLAGAVYQVYISIGESEFAGDPVGLFQFANGKLLEYAELFKQAEEGDIVHLEILNKYSGEVRLSADIHI